MLVPYSTEDVEAEDLAIGDMVEIEGEEFFVTGLTVRPDGAIDLDHTLIRHDITYRLTCNPGDLITRITVSAEIADRMPNTYL